MHMKTSVIYCGDCTNVMHNHIPNESIDLIYIDPPFFSERHYEILWGNGYEMRSFEDRWKGGIENYIAWMEQKLRECYRILKKTGSMYLHCDYHANAHLRILMDKIFDRKNFLREIIWSIETASGFKSQANMWIRGHDTLLLYRKGEKYTFNKQFYPLDEKTLRRYDKIDKDGRSYKIYYAKGGKKKTSSKGVRTVYLDQSKGRPITDVWTDIIGFQTVQPKREYLDYPTQKPEALLERIIKASSNPTDIVLDPMCGCGTAIAVAHKLKRQWIGIDVSPTACKLMAKRMIDTGAIPEVIGLPKSIEEIKSMQPFEFQNWVMEMLTAHPSKVKVGDMGIDGRLIDGTPIQVKHSESVGRNVIDNFETAMKRENKKKGIIIALSFGKGAHEEAARAKNQDGLEIELKTVEDLIIEE